LGVSKLDAVILSVFTVAYSSAIGLIAGWWLSILSYRLWPELIPESLTARVAFSGLAFGSGAGLVLLMWVDITRIYMAAPVWLFIWYTVSSLPAISLSMGLPVGNLILGSVAGVYIARSGIFLKLDTYAIQYRLRWQGGILALICAAEMAALWIGYGLMGGALQGEPVDVSLIIAGMVLVAPITQYLLLHITAGVILRSCAGK